MAGITPCRQIENQTGRRVGNVVGATFRDGGADFKNQGADSTTTHRVAALEARRLRADTVWPRKAWMPFVSRRNTSGECHGGQRSQGGDRRVVKCVSWAGGDCGAAPWHAGRASAPSSYSLNDGSFENGERGPAAGHMNNAGTRTWMVLRPISTTGCCGVIPLTGPRPGNRGARKPGSFFFSSR